MPIASEDGQIYSTALRRYTSANNPIDGVANWRPTALGRAPSNSENKFGIDRDSQPFVYNRFYAHMVHVGCVRAPIVDWENLVVEGNDSSLKYAILSLRAFFNKSQMGARLSPNLLRCPALSWFWLAFIIAFTFRQLPASSSHGIKEDARLKASRLSRMQRAPSEYRQCEKVKFVSPAQTPDLVGS